MTAAELDELQAALPLMTPAERLRVRAILKAKARGFRSNRYIDTLRPNLFPDHPRDNPKQRAFLGLDCLEALFGGSGGGGKTEALLIAALQYVDEPKYSAILIMDTFTNLEGPGALLHRAREWLCTTFPEIAFSAKSYTFRFPTKWQPRHIARRRQILESQGKDLSGVTDAQLLAGMGPPPPAELSFGYLQNSDDKYKYKSKEYQFCVTEGTPVLMSDGSYLPIESVRTGDLVMTLEGPRAVRKVYGRRIADCVEVRTGSGDSQIHPADHPVLTSQGWMSYDRLLKSTQYPESRTPSLRSCGISLSHGQTPGIRLLDSEPLSARRQSPFCRPGRLESSASTIDGQSDTAASRETRRVASRPGELFALGVLHAPDLRSGRELAPVLRCATSGDRFGLLSQDSPGDYQSSFRSCDERSLLPRDTSLSGLPSRVDAEEHNPVCCILDEAEGTPKRSRTHLIEYAHPYTKEWRSSSEAVQLSPLSMIPVGARAVYDIAIDEVSHYITRGGLVNKNCGFDELTAQANEEDYSYLFSRLRRLEWSDVPIRMRAATNPGGKGHLWVRDRFIPEAYMMADEETQFGTIWKNEKPCDECGQTGRLEKDWYTGTCFYCEGNGNVSATFVPARARDNKSLDLQSYMVALSKMTALERARMERGDWGAVEEGDVFRSEWFRHYIKRGEHYLIGKNGSEGELYDSTKIVYFQTVDTASTDKNYSDWTAITTWALCTEPMQLFLVNVTRKKLLIPDILPAIRADFDRYGAMAVVLEEKASGIAVIQGARRTDGGLPIIGYNPGRAGKIERATTASALMEAGKIAFPAGAAPRWLTEFVAEILSFPNAVHDDQVDTLSMAAWYVSRKQFQGKSVAPRAVVMPHTYIPRRAA